MTSKTKIEKKLRKKENPELAKLIISLKKQKNKFWLDIANLLASPKRKSIEVNIIKINKNSKPNDIVIVPGKILSEGSLEHELTIAYSNASEKAKEKLKKAKIISIEQLAKQNPEARGVKVIV